MNRRAGTDGHGFIKYCKRGYFRWGKISRKCWQDISRGGYFHDTTPNSFIKVQYNLRIPEFDKTGILSPPDATLGPEFFLLYSIVKCTLKTGIENSEFRTKLPVPVYIITR